jgi:HlyD family secretion protein
MSFPGADQRDREGTSVKRRVITVVISLAIVAVAAGAAWRWMGRDGAAVLTASGTIEATEVQVSFKVAGRVVERLVDEGQRVDAGTVVARLESRELEAEVDRLRASLRATETRLPQLRTEIALASELTGARIAEARAALAARDERLAELRTGSRRQDVERAAAEVREARATMENARADLERMEELHRRELIAVQQRDHARTALAVATERHRAAMERLDMMREGPRVEEIRRAEADVLQARAALALARTGTMEVQLKRQQLATHEAQVAGDRAALAAAETQLGYTVVASPLGGVVLRKHVEAGEMIGAGTPVVTVADLERVWLKIYVPEYQLGRVKLGQTVDVATDSYPGKVYRGTVTFIASEAEFTPKNIQTPDERVKLVFAVKVTLDNPGQELRPAMPADARMRVD